MVRSDLIVDDNERMKLRLAYMHQDEIKVFLVDVSYGAFNYVMDKEYLISLADFINKAIDEI